MNKIAILTYWMILLACTTTGHPHLYNPYYSLFRYNEPYLSYGSYANHITPYKPVVPATIPQSYLQDPILTPYITQPNEFPTLNVLAEIPYKIRNDFTTVPMVVVAKENMNMVVNGDIMGVSKKKPIMTVKSENSLLQCTPAVKIILKTPILVYSLKSTIVFPTEIDILHGRYYIPIKVGAVIAPVPHDTYISTESPISLNVVYAVPTRPISLDYVNNNNVFVNYDNQAVVVESEPVLPPRNITIINFPEKLAEPVLGVDEEDGDLVNRQPPIALAPAGIAQSTQPQTIHGQFNNSKESPILTALREEALKHRLIRL